MIIFRILLLVILAVLISYTGIVIANHGIGLLHDFRANEKNIPFNPGFTTCRS
jgi:hypothetical protein